MIKLKRCPFCGGIAVLHGGYKIVPIIDENGAYVDADIDISPCYVECSSCHSIGEGFDGDNENDEENAIKAWNHRVNI